MKRLEASSFPLPSPNLSEIIATDFVTISNSNDNTESVRLF